MVPLPTGRKKIRTKWAQDINNFADEKVLKTNAALLAKRFSQKAGVDYFEVFAPVWIYTTALFIIAFSKIYGWNQVQLVIKTEFPNASLNEEIYVEETERVVVHIKE